jgi:chemotaxis protein CheD
MEPVVVGMADGRVATDPEQMLVTYALGSCIGLSLYDSAAHVGGMLHFMLPESAIDPARARQNPYMFADTGVPLLIEQLRARGASPRSLVAHAAGGAAILVAGNPYDIGKRNYMALRKLLWKAGVLLSAEAVGGSVSRTVRLEISSGRLWLQEGEGARNPVAGFPRSGHAPVRAAFTNPNPAFVDTERKRQWLTGY